MKNDPDPNYYRVIGLGLILIVAAVLLFLYMADDARGATPTRAEAQRLAARAYDQRLRPRYGVRAGIVTRCQGKGPRWFCTVHVYKDGVERYWQQTRLILHTGKVRTVIDSNLAGCIAVPNQRLHLESRPLH